MPPTDAAASVLGGSTPWGAIAQTGVGIFQSILNAGKAKKAQRELEGMAKNYQYNPTIMDYYNKALAKYNPNAYQSQAYQQQQNQIGRNLATGIGASQDRRGGLANIAALTQGADDASRKAVVSAEQMQNQNLSQLGAAARLKATEENKPFEMRYNLLAQKAGAANQGVNAGIKNMFGGLSGISDYEMAKQFGGDGTSITKYGKVGNPNRLKILPY